MDDAGESEEPKKGAQKKERERKYRQREVVDGGKKANGGSAAELEGVLGRLF